MSARRGCVDPGTEARLPNPQLPPRLEDRVLRDVLGVVPIADEPEREAFESRCGLAEERRERGRVAVPGCVEEEPLPGGHRLAAVRHAFSLL
jgi:hypothetical protein